jgi:hypothetical protein
MMGLMAKKMMGLIADDVLADCLNYDGVGG